ncbi:hypothetical protein C8R47DRAFT_1224626 [Mycena vitilis]|nr:hypothetical protein C8R47DRAFT_1224626 [Mycena vitilis]
MAGPYISLSHSISAILILVCLSHGLHIPGPRAPPQIVPPPTIPPPTAPPPAQIDDGGTHAVCALQFKAVTGFPTLKINIRGNKVCKPTTPFYKYTKGQDSLMPKTGQTWWTDTKKPFSWGQEPDVRCEHVLELNILKKVMESPGGPWDQIVKLVASGHSVNDPIISNLYTPLVGIINGQENVVFASKMIESQKERFVAYAQNSQASLAVTGFTGTDSLSLLKAANDYLVKTKDGTDSLQGSTWANANTQHVASQLDQTMAAAIKAANPSASPMRMTVVNEWTKVLAIGNSLASSHTAAPPTPPPPPPPPPPTPPPPSGP